MSEITNDHQGEKKEIENNINPEYAENLNNLSPEEITAIYNLLLNEGDSSTWINNAVKFYTGNKTLDDNQKMLLAPANAFENTARSVGSLFTEDGISNMYEGIKNIQDLPDTVKNLWFVFYSKLNRKQKLAVGIQVGTESFFIGKAIEKIVNALKTLKRIKLIGLKEDAIPKAKLSSDITSIVPSISIKTMAEKAEAFNDFEEKRETTTKDEKS